MIELLVVLVGVGLFAIVVSACRGQANDGASRSVNSEAEGPKFTVGETVIVNTIGVGTILEGSDHANGDGTVDRGYKIQVKDKVAFVPLDRVESLIHRPVSTTVAQQMLDSAMQAQVTGEQSKEERTKRFAELLKTGTHLEQAAFLGQMLALGKTENVALIVGFHHVLEEISLVLKISREDLKTKFETQYPWLQGIWGF